MKIITAGRTMFMSIPHLQVSCIGPGFMNGLYDLTHSKDKVSDKNMNKNLSAIQSFFSLYDYNLSAGVTCVFLLHTHDFGKYEHTTMTRSSVHFTGLFSKRVNTVNCKYTLANNEKNTSAQQNCYTYSDQTDINNVELEPNRSNITAYQNFTIYNGKSPISSNTSTFGICNTVDVAVPAVMDGTAIVIRSEYWGIRNGK